MPDTPTFFEITQNYFINALGMLYKIYTTILDTGKAFTGRQDQDRLYSSFDRWGLRPPKRVPEAFHEFQQYCFCPNNVVVSMLKPCSQKKRAKYDIITTCKPMECQRTNVHGW